MSNVIDLHSRRPSPWAPAHDRPIGKQRDPAMLPACSCAACYIRAMGADLDRLLTDTSDLFSHQADRAMRHFLDQLGELCGVRCQYESQAQQ